MSSNLKNSVDVASLDSAGLASYLNSVELFAEACRYATRAPRDPSYDIASIEMVAGRSVLAAGKSGGEKLQGDTKDGEGGPPSGAHSQHSTNDAPETHPALTAFIIRQSVTGADFVSPRFVPELLLPYLENVLGMNSISLTALVGSTTERKAQTFDLDPDAETLFLFLEAMIDRTEDGIDDHLDYCVRSLALLHYAIRVAISGKMSPESVSTSPVRGGADAAGGAAAGGQNHHHHRRGSSSMPGPPPPPGPRAMVGLLGDFDEAGDGDAADADGAALAPIGSIASLPHSSFGPTPALSPSARAVAGQDRGPVLPKQEPLSGTRRVHRKWDQWLEIGKQAFFENSNLPVMVDGVSYTACACFTEALEDYMAGRMGSSAVAESALARSGAAAGAGACAGGGGGRPTSLDAAVVGAMAVPGGGGRNLFGDSVWDANSPSAPPAAAAAADTASFTPPPANNTSTASALLNFDAPTPTSPTTLASELKTEAELWNLLSQAIYSGGSAVTVMGEMHTKESAMAMAVQADVENADRWLDLARLLPSETGKKRISKRKQKNMGAGNLRSGNGPSGGGGGGRNNNAAGGAINGNSSAPRGRKLNLGLNFSDSPRSAGNKSPASPGRRGKGGRKLGLGGAFDDFDFSTPKTAAGGGAGGKDQKMAALIEEQEFSRRSTTTREVVPTVDGRAVSRVQAYAESLRINDTRPSVWSELGLHMPLHPPNDSIFISNTSYSSRRCHETALERDMSLADSWLDLGWQLMEDKKVSVIHSKVFGATECFIEALGRVPSDVGEAWSLLAQSLDDKPDASVTVDGETMTKIQCFHRALQFDDQCISAWIGLGRMLPRGSSCEVQGKTFTQLGLFYHALEMDDTDAVAWNGLGAMLGPVDKAVFRGETYSRRQCYLQALQCDMYLARVWNNLGLDLGDSRVPKNRDAFGVEERGTSYVVIHGRKFDNKACFVRALHCEGGNVSTSWVNLGMLLDPDPDAEGGSVIVQGRPANKKKCYQEAVRANEANAIAWNNLGAVMDATETIVIHKHPCNKLSCYRNALENDDTLSNAWYNATCVLVRMEKDPDVEESDMRFRVRGQEYNKISCSIKAVLANQENGNAWKMLADLMKEGDLRSVKMPPGNSITDGKEMKLTQVLKMCDKYPVRD